MLDSKPEDFDKHGRYKYGNVTHYGDIHPRDYTVNCDKCKCILKQYDKAVIITKGEILIHPWNTEMTPMPAFRLVCVPCYRKMDSEPMDIDDYNEDLNKVRHNKINNETENNV